MNPDPDPNTKKRILKNGSVADRGKPKAKAKEPPHRISSSSSLSLYLYRLLLLLRFFSFPLVAPAGFCDGPLIPSERPNHWVDRRRLAPVAMAEAPQDDLLQLIKRFGAYLTLKFSNLFSSPLSNLNSRSVGAIAGFAVAIIFTWRLLRSPSGSQRRVQKRQASSSNSAQAAAAASPSGISSTSEESRAQNVIDEFFQPVKPTLGQIVRQKLSEGRKVTCRLLGVILEENTPEELQKQATVKSSVLEVLLEITKFCDLYLMERVLDDESEKKVLVALEDAGVFTSGGLVKDKVLFCSTENGRSSFVRQLEPDWHVDTNPEIITQLARFIKYELHISPNRPEKCAPNVFSSSSLEQFFGCM